MINKKRVELYLQRKTRMHDTHDDVMSSDFDMDDCDFKLDGTEGNFDYQLPPGTNVYEERKAAAKLQDEPELDLADIVIPTLPDIGLESINNTAFELWEKTKQHEQSLNNANKAELKTNIQEVIAKTPFTSLKTIDPRAAPKLTPAFDTFKKPNPVLAALTEDTVSNFVDSWYGRSVTSVKDFDKHELWLLVKLALSFRHLAHSGMPLPKLMKDKLISLYFTEPSTRTRCSFQAAALRLGGQTIVIHNVAASSAAKGESLYDSVRVLSSYSDAIVVRDGTTGSIPLLTGRIPVPILSGGDGSGEHPSQALLDLVTMASEKQDMFDVNRTEPIKVAFAGDLSNSRTVASLAKMLATMPKIEMTFVAIQAFNIGDDLFNEIANLQPSTPPRRIPALCEDVGRADFIYVTRTQTERLNPVQRNLLDASSAPLVHLNLKTLLTIKAKPTLRIMHPLPRAGEIAEDLDSTSHQLYFEQADNGLYTRMALLSLCISEERNKLKSLMRCFY